VSKKDYSVRLAAAIAALFLSVRLCPAQVCEDGTTTWHAVCGRGSRQF
jgi:hypothetical protein